MSRPRKFATPAEKRKHDIVAKRHTRLAKALKEGRAFIQKPKGLHAAHVRAYKKQQLYDARMRAKTALFVGPPKPTPSSIGRAAYHRWLYAKNLEYRAYHIAKRKRYVQEISLSYARYRLGVKDAPIELVEVKRLNLFIKRKLKESTDEERR